MAAGPADAADIGDVDFRPLWVRADFYEGDEVKADYEVDGEPQARTYYGTVIKVVLEQSKQNSRAKTVKVKFTSMVDPHTQRRVPHKDKKLTVFSRRPPSGKGTKDATTYIDHLTLVDKSGRSAGKLADNVAKPAAAGVKVDAGFSVVKAGFERVTGCFAVCCEVAGVGRPGPWRVPWIHIAAGAGALVNGKRIAWFYDAFDHLDVVVVYDKANNAATEPFQVHDPKAFLAWAACRNVMLAHQRTLLAGSTLPGYLATLLNRSAFQMQDKDSLKELLAWLFTINFAGDNSVERGMGWQRSFRFLAEFNKQAKLLDAITMAGDMTTRGFNDGMDPANYLGPSIYPNDKIDGKIAGAGDVWSARIWNDFGTQDLDWRQHPRERWSLVRQINRPTLRGAGGLIAEPPLYANLIAQLREFSRENLEDFAGQTTEGISDDGADRHTAHLKHLEDLEMCKVDRGGVTNATGAYEGPSPVTGRLQSLFGTLAHEWAITELLGLAYSSAAQGSEDFADAKGQMEKLDVVVSEFPVICSRVGNILATRLARDAAKVSNLRSNGLDSDASGTIEVGAAVPALVTVDLLSAVPFTYPPLAAVPDALFSVTSQPAGEVTVVGEFKTQWKASQGGFRWSVGEGLAYRRQAVFEACAHFLTSGNRDMFVPVQPWVALVKTPAAPRVKEAVSYSAHADIDTLNRMQNQLKLLYTALFPTGGSQGKQRVPAGFMSPSRYAPATSATLFRDSATLRNDITKAAPGLGESFAVCPIRLRGAVSSGFVPGAKNNDPKLREYWYLPNEIAVAPALNVAKHLTENIRFGAARGIVAALFGHGTTPESRMDACNQLALDMAVTLCKPVESTWAGQVASLVESFHSTTPLDTSTPRKQRLMGSIEMVLADAYAPDASVARSYMPNDAAVRKRYNTSGKYKTEEQYVLDVEREARPLEAAVKLRLNRGAAGNDRKRLERRFTALAADSYLLNPEGATAFGYIVKKDDTGALTAVPTRRPGNLRTMKRNSAKDSDRHANYRMYFSGAKRSFQVESTARRPTILSAGKDSFLEPELTNLNPAGNDAQFYHTDWPSFSFYNSTSYRDSAKRLNRDIARALETPVATVPRLVAKSKPKRDFKVGARVSVKYDRPIAYRGTIIEVERTGDVITKVEVQFDEKNEDGSIEIGEFYQDKTKNELKSIKFI